MIDSRTNPDYLRIPNYACAREVPTVDVTSLTSAAFQRSFVNRNCPCLIRGAAAHWAACHRWSSTDYLKTRCGDVEVTVHTEPVVEADSLLSSAEKRAWLKLLRLIRQPRTMRFAEFLDRACNEERDEQALFFLYSVPLGPGDVLGSLGGDLGSYSFLKETKRAVFGTYPRNNVYFYRSSVTDWHYHASAEALQTQILGVKEVMMLPPTQRVWSYMHALHSQRLHLFNVDLSQFPQAREVVPLRAVLHPGDALFIPCFWWHLVSTRGNRSLGATVPTWWRSPLHIQCDPAVPALRAAFSRLHHSELKHWQTLFLACAVMFGASWSVARGMLRPIPRE